VTNPTRFCEKYRINVASSFSIGENGDNKPKIIALPLDFHGKIVFVLTS
jgi:hypothetical protein